MKGKILSIWLFFGIFLTLVTSVAAIAAESPTTQLQPTLSNLTDLLADKSLKGDEHRTERRARIMEAIEVGFDFQEMSKRILGRTWNEIQEGDRQQFTELMTKLLENIYIGKLESYSGQEIEFLDERVKGNRAQVSTVIDNNGVKIPVHYIMSLNSSKWMVYDINIEGVSLVKNYMEQFKAILRKEKFPGLIKVLKEKNQSFEVGKPEGK
jgi:phospholipid transport system substrate-binding protein